MAQDLLTAHEDIHNTSRIQGAHASTKKRAPEGTRFF